MKFSDLTWEDLQDWAGDKVVNRGKSYKRAVEDLRVTADGALIAWVVDGTGSAPELGLNENVFWY